MGDIPEQVTHMNKGTGQENNACVQGAERHTELRKGSEEQRARKESCSLQREFLRSVSCHLAILQTQCSISSLPASNKLYA